MIRGILLTTFALLFAARTAECGSWEISVLATSDELLARPRVSGDKVVWTQGFYADSEVFLYDTGVVSQVTDNNIDDRYPDVVGDRIAWIQHFENEERTSSDDQRSLLVNGVTIVTGSDRLGIDTFERTGLAWSAYHPPTNDWEIFYFDGSEKILLEFDGAQRNYNPELSGGRVVWSATIEHEIRVLLYDGSTVKLLPRDVGRGQAPEINGDYIAGTLVESGTIVGVTRYNFATDHLETFHMGKRFITTPRISNNFMAWGAHVEGIYHAFTLVDEEILQLSSAANGASMPMVSDNFVAWTERDNEGLEALFVYDGVNVQKLADGQISLSDVDDNSIVWNRFDGMSYEVLMATRVVPEPASVAILFVAAAILPSLRISFSR